MGFRDRILEDYAIIFEGTSGDNEKEIIDGDFAERWGWFGIMHRLCNQDISKLDTVTRLNLLECLTWLSYETDLNLSKTVKRHDKQ